MGLVGVKMFLSLFLLANITCVITVDQCKILVRKKALQGDTYVTVPMINRWIIAIILSNYHLLSINMECSYQKIHAGNIL